MSNYISKFAFVVLITFLLSSCDSDEQYEKKEPAQEDKTVKIDSVIIEKKVPKIINDPDLTIKLHFDEQDGKKLFWVDSIPLGSTYKQVKSKIPALPKPGKTDGIAIANILIDQEKVIMQLLFAKDTLQSINYIIQIRDSKQADYYFKGVRNFYSKKMGAFEKEKVEEESRFSPSYYFDYHGTQLTVSNNINEGNVNWIFEKGEE